jgi:ABC-type amino acid transport substrate-binding protein
MIRTCTLALALLLAAGAVQSQALEGRLKSIAASKSIAIAHRTDAKPFSFTDDKKQVGGFSIEVCKRVVTSIARQLNVPALDVKWVPVTTATRFDAVAKGQADMECGASTVTLSRLKQVDFSSYIFVESTGLLVRAASGLRSFADMAGKTIAVVSGTTNESVVQRRVKQGRIAANVATFRTREAALAALEAGKADAFASDKLLLVGAVASAKDPRALAMLPDDLSLEPYGIVLPRGDADFRLAVNTALAQFYASGEIADLFRHWFGQFGEPSAVVTIMYLLGAIPE